MKTMKKLSLILFASILLWSCSNQKSETKPSDGYDVVILNKGERDSLEVGHVLTIMQSGRVVKDPHSANEKNELVVLPAEIAGSLMVFRTFEKTSLALVMRANRPMHVMDTAVTPQ